MCLRFHSPQVPLSPCGALLPQRLYSMDFENFVLIFWYLYFHLYQFGSTTYKECILFGWLRGLERKAVLTNTTGDQEWKAVSICVPNSISRSYDVWDLSKIKMQRPAKKLLRISKEWQECQGLGCFKRRPCIGCRFIKSIVAPLQVECDQWL